MLDSQIQRALSVNWFSISCGRGAPRPYQLCGLNCKSPELQRTEKSSYNLTGINTFILPVIESLLPPTFGKKLSFEKDRLGSYILNQSSSSAWAIQIMDTWVGRNGKWITYSLRAFWIRRGINFLSKNVLPELKDFLLEWVLPCQQKITLYPFGENLLDRHCSRLNLLSSSVTSLSLDYRNGL